ncbi:DoxX [Salipiger aestuarii]|uniref:Putative oxidoreductase n=1 Tax=Salipiger aestuarii TaxID=568098 RepID=A0A327YFG7_9RHOB|nr:DoxX family membrane protein [Salipiger aestuarii]EIE50796.1 DoxX subfamily protein, putative [Citreicella sp. 357]KAB2542981.1 DoxX [Salipiger aestuarii]RAK19643.1 putative oxidoreductase [Salipiger aestuarii]
MIAAFLKANTAPLPCASAVIGASARLVFGAVLAGYFWASGLTKLDGTGLSANAYIQIFPRQMEAAGYDPSALPALAHAVTAAGTLAEFALPLLILLGLFTRLSAVGMLGFLAVMTLTDIVGHGIGAETIGAPFDRDATGLVWDQRLLWAWLLGGLALTGAGPLSVDRMLQKRVAGRSARGSESPCT